MEYTSIEESIFPEIERYSYDDFMSSAYHLSAFLPLISVHPVISLVM